MNERLTNPNGDGFIACNGCTRPMCTDCEQFKAQAAKLAYYENMEESRRLVALPRRDYVFTIRGDIAIDVIKANCYAASKAEIQSNLERTEGQK